MSPIEPHPGELEDNECAAYWVSHEAIKRSQIEQARQMALDFAGMDYCAVRAWEGRYAKLRDREKELRRAIFGWRRRTSGRRRNAGSALIAATVDCACAKPPAAGSGAPTPPTPAEPKPALRRLRAVPKC